jgi:outer membrane protein OmpA-like peptidoglycan-associated protein
MKILAVCMLVMSTTALSAFAQTTSSGNPSTASTSNAGATAVVQNDNAPQAIINSYPQDPNTTVTAAGFARQFPGAVPGVVGEGPFPGYALPPGRWAVYCPAFLKTVSYDDIDRMRKHSKAKVTARTWDKNPTKSSSITCIGWDAQAIAHGHNGQPIDRPLGEASVIGKHGMLDIPDVMEGFHHLKDTDTNRVLVLVRTNDKSVTGAHSFGLGISGAATPGNPTKGIAGALGAEFGKSTTEVQDYPEFLMYALNDGPITAPSLPQQQQQVTEAKAPPPQTLRIEIPTIKVEVIQTPAPAAPLAIQQIPAPMPQYPADACAGIPDFTVFFDLDKAIVKNEFQPKIKEMADWLRQHSGCKVNVVGHASKEASVDYNAKLAYHRAKAVRWYLLADGANPQQVLWPLSASKEFPGYDDPPENRRVILEVAGHTTGK